MNRRDVMKAAGAMVAMCLVPFSSVKASRKRVEKSMTQAIVVAPAKLAPVYREVIGNLRNIRVVAPGQHLMGFQADYVILDHPTFTTTREKDWFNQAVRTRLVPGGRIVNPVKLQHLTDYQRASDVRRFLADKGAI